MSTTLNKNIISNGKKTVLVILHNMGKYSSEFYNPYSYIR